MARDSTGPERIRMAKGASKPKKADKKAPAIDKKAKKAAKVKKSY